MLSCCLPDRSERCGCRVLPASRMGIPSGVCSSSRKKRLFVEVAFGHGTPCLSIQLPRRRSVSSPGIEPGLRPPQSRVRSGTLRGHIALSTPPRNRTPSGRIEVCRAIHHTRRAKSENRRCVDHRSPIIDSCQLRTICLPYELLGLASDSLSASPWRSKSKYNRALAFLASSRSVCSSASRNSAGCRSGASAALTRSS